MIGRVYPLGKGFKGLVSYLETGKDGRQKQHDRVQWVEFRNLPTRNPRTAACMMAATANASVSGTTTPVYHFSISCDPGDPVGPDTLRHVAARTIRDLGLEEHEVLIFAHKDRSHPHLHFVVNRVHPERYTLWRPWQDYVGIERSLRAQEVELGLRVVPGTLAPIPTHAVDGLGQGGAEAQLRSQPAIRRGDAAFIAAVTERAVPVLERSQSWAELERGLAEHGLAVRVKGGGITLTDGRQEAKASEVGRQFSRGNLEKRFGSYPDYRARMAVSDQIARTRYPVQAATDAQESTTQPHPDPVVESRPAQEPQRESRGNGFLQHVKQRATPVFERAQSWAELEQGLSDHGFFLRVQGGGFVVTDGEHEVKASEVGRPFSRFHLEKRLGRYLDPGASVAQPEIPVPADTDAVALPEPMVSPAPEADARPVDAAPPAPASKPHRTQSTRVDEQLEVTFAEPPTPTAPLTPAREPVAPVQIGLPLVEPPAPPRRQEKRTPAAPPVSRVESPTPAPGVIPLAPPPELLRAGELLREGLASYEAERMESSARTAADAAATKLNRLRKLDETASIDATRLRDALDRVFTDSPQATVKLSSYVRTHGWDKLRSALKQSPQQFGRLRYPRPWYTLGRGRKDVEGIIDPLKIATKSVPNQPTPFQLDTAEAHARDTAKIYNAARKAKDALRYPTQYEHEAANALRPLLRDASPEWIARQLASLLPSDDREAAQMVERVLGLALTVTRTLTRERGRSRGIDF